MGVLSKAFRVLGLVLLLCVGLTAIFIAHAPYIFDKVPVSLAGNGRVEVGTWDSGVVVAQGTWTIDGQRHAYPMNMSEIHCVRQERRCYTAEARLTDRYLTAELEQYDIWKWDNSTLEFGAEKGCVTYVYAINRSTERLAGRRIKKNPLPELCEGGNWRAT